jgi:hypothetical protein
MKNSMMKILYNPWIEQVVPGSRRPKESQQTREKSKPV